MNSTSRWGDPVESIHTATLAELADAGRVDLDLERLASRAATSPDEIRTRWPHLDDLVVEALVAAQEHAHWRRVTPGTSLRTDLVALLGAQARDMTEVHGLALRAVLAHRQRNPELAARVTSEIVVPRQQLWVEVVAEAAGRGEVRPSALSPRVLAVGPQLLAFEDITAGPVPPAEVEALVDEVLLPLLRR